MEVKLEDEGLKVYVDSREPAHGKRPIYPVVTKVFDELGVNWERRALVNGDYAVIGDDGYTYLIVERKSITDLLQSLGDERFNIQSKRSILSPRTLWIIYGTPSDLREHCERLGLDYNLNKVRGAIASLYVRYGIDVIWVINDNEFAKILGRIMKKYQEGKEWVPARGTKSRSTIEGMKVSIFISIAGISSRIAREMLAQGWKLKLVKDNLLNATKEEVREELMKISGIGDSKADRILTLVGE